jgi:dihydroxyacetone kinase-like protein
MEARIALQGKNEFTLEDLVKALEAALKGIMNIGKSKPGEKTMIDAISPAIEAMRKALANGSDPVRALEEATQAAEEGMRATIPMIAQKGRASYLGERSIGHQDPGATSSYLLFRTMLGVAKEQQG